MGYQALLFCPEEKTARTVTQVLSELEFTVQSCTEPFIAVKKLMAEHFDAVVVDCDNEQNATLLFKSARNSTSNQTSLAVAVVEGQAGVAKAFRIGANLVLTKPINVEQAKGTLRVARGLLRKGEPPKAPAASGPAPASIPNKSSAVAPGASSKSNPSLAVPAAHRPASLEEAKAALAAGLKPGRAANARIASPSETNAPPIEPDILDVDTEAPAKPAAVAHSSTGFGAASAPAPARTAQEAKSDHGAATLELDDLGSNAAKSSLPAPSFTFGGNASESTGISKKAIIGLATAALIAIGIYFGWTHGHQKSEQPPATVQTPAPTNASPQPTQLSKPQPAVPSSASSTSASTKSSSISSNLPVEKPARSSNIESDEETPEDNPPAHKNSEKKGNDEAEKDASEAKPAQQPLMVKGGKTAHNAAKTTPAVDAPAPDVLAIAPATSGGDLPNLVSNADAPTPVLQTLNVSQGVSQGLLIKKVQPTYPAAALRMHVEGSVQLAATIGKNGSINSVKILSGEPLLSQAALEAVRQWKYKPYYLNGEPVEIQTQITVNFKLPR